MTLPPASTVLYPVLRQVRAAAVYGLVFSLISTSTAQAIGFIRDAETEGLIRTYAKPILEAAGLGATGYRHPHRQ